MAKKQFSGKVYLELNLGSNTKYKSLRRTRPQSNLELFRVIERAGKDKKIGGIILNLSSFNAERETLWELRNSLERFKSTGKKICAFLSSADLDKYCLATAADKIVFDEQGGLALTGYCWGRSFVKHSLEKIGVAVRELRYMEYKSAMETFTRNSLSDADRKQYGEILDDIMEVTREAVTKARGWTAEEFDTVLNDFLFSSKSALERGLVDSIGRKDAVIKTINELSGQEIKHFAVYGNKETSLTEAEMLYRAPRAGGLFCKSPIIAVVYASGTTDMESGMAAGALAHTIKEVLENKRVKAMVVRMNSPGGSAEAADYISEAIKAVKEKIPVVVSMGAVAASGGYWASMSANHIVASPLTLTGSIGVIASWFYENGLNKKLGLTVDYMQRGKHSDLTTGFFLPHRNLDEEEENRAKQLIIDSYNDFTAKVAAFRGMDIDRVESLAQGRVYSGAAALKAGLIDSLGGLDDAIRIAKELANISAKKKITYKEYPKPKFKDRLLEKLLSSQTSIGTFALTKLANNYGETAAALAASFLSTSLPEEISFRIAHNGKALPILPLDSQLLKVSYQ
ncbi:MAG: signal peptide peptidase SppA [Treponema sp.]|nr:signal peptide peptidase SppA [Treponema sp.]